VIFTLFLTDRLSLDLYGLAAVKRPYCDVTITLEFLATGKFALIAENSLKASIQVKFTKK